MNKKTKKMEMSTMAVELKKTMKMTRVNTRHQQSYKEYIQGYKEYKEEKGQCSARREGGCIQCLQAREMRLLQQ
ncbi:hypothetical protein ACFO5U_14845 [Planococcus dechangensis]|uniref:Uncharacterized protein n=1 Tax=Planococcus dechangensis TaxID=1176255 RepID=A0ABV9MFP3_9BACL